MEEKMETKEQVDNSAKKKLTLKVAIISLLLIVLLVTIFSIGFVYNNANRNENYLLKNLTNRMPFPAAVLGVKGAVSISQLQDNLDSVQRFYESQDFSELELRVDFSTEDGKKRLKIKQKEILDKMIEDEAVKALSEREKIIITADEVSAIVKQRLEEYGSRESVEDDLNRKYGWSIDDFEKKVVTPSLYRERLEQLALEKYIKSDKAKSEIEGVKSEMAGGLSFEEAAKKYSQGSTAEEGGRVGWITKDQLLPELALQLSDLKDGAMSDIVESQIGFHILRLEERKREQGIELFNLSQIFIRKPTFVDWIRLEKSEMPIFIPLGEFKWNSDEARVDFESEKMVKFEKEMLEKADGDVSLMF